MHSCISVDSIALKVPLIYIYFFSFDFPFQIKVGIATVLRVMDLLTPLRSCSESQIQDLKKVSFTQSYK